MKILPLLQKDFLIIIKSKFFLILLISFFTFYFIYEIIDEFRYKINIYSSEDILIKIQQFINHDKIIITDKNPNLVLHIENQGSYWIVDIEPSSTNDFKIVPILSLMLYKFYFHYNNLIDPIKINVKSKYTQDVVYSLLLNMMIWSLLSFISSDINNEKNKRTVLIYNDIASFLLSKSIIISSIFAVFLYGYMYFFYFDFYKFIISTILFFCFCYIYGFINWLFKSVYLNYVFNLFIGLIVLLSPLWRINIEPNLFYVIILLIVTVGLIIVIKNKNKQLQGLVWGL